ncbi:hypothetical protein LJC56_06715 [Christensenellaceae bacterium OttesenSCG-928-K19]|nr:hypothetical protein [Christensenellaceae bacterium OttesenSCG-928-K19]
MGGNTSVSQTIGYLFPLIICLVTVFSITAIYTAARRKEAALSARQSKTNIFVIKNTKGVLGIGIFCMSVFGFFFVLCLYAVLGQQSLTGREGIILSSFFAAAFAACVFMTIYAARWGLVVSDDIFYTPTIGRTQIVAFHDISYALLSMNYLKVYDHSHRRIFTLQATCVGGATFIRLLQIKGIPFSRPCSSGDAFVYSLRHRGERRATSYASKSMYPRLREDNRRK